MSGPAQPPRGLEPYGPDLLTPSLPVSRRERAGASADLHPPEARDEWAAGVEAMRALLLEEVALRLDQTSGHAAPWIDRELRELRDWAGDVVVPR